MCDKITGLVKTVDFVEFQNDLKNYFSYEALKVIFNSLNNLGNELGEAHEYYPMLIREEFKEYKSLNDAAEDLLDPIPVEKNEIIRKLQYHCTNIIELNNDGVVVEV